MAPAAPATNAHHPIEVATTSSGDLAMDVKIRRSTVCEIKNPANNNKAAANSALRMGHAWGLEKFGWSAKTKMA